MSNNNEVHKYSFKEYSPHFNKIMPILFNSGLSLLLGSLFLFIILYFFMREEPGFFSLLGASIGGSFGTCIPIFFNHGRPVYLGRRIGVPDQLSTFEKQIQVVVVHFRSRLLILLFSTPFYMWIIYEYLQSNLQLGSGIGLMVIFFVFSFPAAFGLSAGVQYLHVYWSLKKEINSYR